MDLRSYNLTFPSLKKISIIKIVSTMIEKICGNKPIDMIDTSFENIRYLWEIERKIIKLMKDIDLPDNIKKEIMFLAKGMSCELNYWKKSPIMLGFRRSAVVKQIVWSPYGLIDEKKSYLKNINKMSAAERIVKACRLYLKDYLEENWKKEYREMFFESFWGEQHLDYWNNYFNCQDLDRPIVLMQKCLLLENVFGAKYFWDMLTPDDFSEGFPSMLLDVGEISETNQALFILHMMKKLEDNHLKALFVQYDILNKLAQFWPDPNAFKFVLNEMFRLRCVTQRKFLTLTLHILNLTPRDPIYFIKNTILIDMWESHARNVTKDGLYSKEWFNILYELFDPEDKSSLQALIVVTKSSLFEDIKNNLRYDEYAKECFLEIIGAGGYIMLNDFFELIGFSKETQEQLKLIYHDDFEEFLHNL